MKIYVFPVLFGMISCQLQPSLLSTLDIPRKIHFEIFGSDSLGHMNFGTPFAHQLKLTSSDQNFLSDPLLSLNRQLHHSSQSAFQTASYRNMMNNDSQTSSSLPIPERLFAPAIVKYPAATKGQMEAYKKALEEEKKEARKEMEKKNQTKFASSYRVRDLEPKAVSYVNVRLGGDKNVNYHYTA